MGAVGRRTVGYAIAGVIAAAAASALALPAGSVARPAHVASAQPAPSIFGLNTGVYDPSHRRYVKDLPMAKDLGARWVDFNGGQNLQWGTLDYEVNEARSLGLGVVLSLGGYSNACSERPRPAAIDCPPAASDLEQYKKDLTSELKRYGSEVTYWESWVEPNHKASWAPKPDPAAYAALLKVQYSVLQSVNQSKGWNLKLLFGSPNDFSIVPAPGQDNIAVLPFTDQVLQALGGAKAFDGIALHAYRYPPSKTGPSVADYDSIAGIPDAPGQTGAFPAEGCTTSGAKWCRMTWPQELSAYEDEFNNRGYGQMPLWLTQFGWPGGYENAPKSGPLTVYFQSEDAQAQDLTEAYNDLLQLPFVQGALWFNVRDYKPGYKNPDPAFFANYGLLKNKFGMKPAAKIFKQLAAQHPDR